MAVNYSKRDAFKCFRQALLEDRGQNASDPDQQTHSLDPFTILKYNLFRDLYQVVRHGHSYNQRSWIAPEQLSNRLKEEYHNDKEEIDDPDWRE